MNGELPRIRWTWSILRAGAPAAVSLAAVSLVACGSPAKAPTVAPLPAPAVATDSAAAVPDACIVATESAGRDTLRVATPEPVEPTHAPVPANDTEQLLFRQFYDTLLRVNCAGQLGPALAEQWISDSTGRIWTFVLRDSHFADGRSITAAAVRESWYDRGRTGAPASAIVSAVPAGDRMLVVTFADPQATAPTWLAQPEFAVAGAAGPGGWPGATGAYQPGPGRAATPRSVSLPPLLLGGEPGGDPRDLLDAGADLLVTHDPAAIAYAAGRSDLLSLPLPWDQTYVLVSSDSLASLIALEPTEVVRLREALARDAVSAEARGAEPPFWWEADMRCSTSSGASTSPHGSRLPGSGRRVAYPRGDRTARELAARLVALIGTAGTAPLIAAGLSPAALAASLSAGDAAGFVLPLARRPPASCRDRPAWPAGATVFPLVDTRARLVVRRGAGPIALDADGTPRIIAPVPAPPPAPTAGAPAP